MQRGGLADTPRPEIERLAAKLQAAEARVEELTEALKQALADIEYMRITDPATALGIAPAAIENIANALGTEPPHGAESDSSGSSS